MKLFIFCVIWFLGIFNNIFADTITEAVNVMNNVTENIYDFKNEGEMNNSLYLIGFGEQEDDYYPRYLFYTINNFTQKHFFVTDLRDNVIRFCEIVFKLENNYRNKIAHIIDTVIKEYKIKPYSGTTNSFPILYHGIICKTNLHEYPEQESYRKFFLYDERIYVDGKRGVWSTATFAYKSKYFFADEPIVIKYAGYPIYERRFVIICILPVIDRNTGFKYVYKVYGNSLHTILAEIKSEEDKEKFLKDWEFVGIY